MSFLSETPTLFSARLSEDHPLSVVPDINFGDDNPSQSLLKIGKITAQLLTQRFKISWPEIEGATTYSLYGSISPTRKQNLLQDGITGLEALFVPPVFSPVIQYYFWVTVTLRDGTTHYLTDEPATLQTTAHKLAFDPNPLTDASAIIPDVDGINAEMPGIFEFIRAGNRFELENDGEPAILFQLRHAEDRPFGVPCECTNSTEAEQDPDYLGRGRCTLCFGTGIYGGYYPSVPIRIRYSGTPSTKVTYDNTGYTTEHGFNTFMLWDPQVRVGDLVVRLVDGTRYKVTERRETSARAIRLHQEFDLEQLGIRDIKNQVTDEQIGLSMDQLNIPGFVRSGFMAFG